MLYRFFFFFSWQAPCGLRWNYHTQCKNSWCVAEWNSWILFISSACHFCKLELLAFKMGMQESKWTVTTWLKMLTYITAHQSTGGPVKEERALLSSGELSTALSIRSYFLFTLLPALFNYTSSSFCNEWCEGSTAHTLSLFPEYCQVLGCIRQRSYIVYTTKCAPGNWSEDFKSAFNLCTF